MTSRVKIITDSSSDVPTDVLQALDIEVVPLTIRFGEEEFVDGIELTHRSFIEKLEKSNVNPSTAAPSPGSFEAAFRKAHENGYSAVICICISSQLSATYQSAIGGAEFVKGVIDVHVIDSRTVSIACGAIVQHAADLAMSHAPAEQILNEVTHLRDRMEIIGTLDTLENLKRGGRIGKASAFFGSILSIKPVIEISGEVRPLSRQRTRARAIQALVNEMQDRMPLEHVIVGDIGAPDLGEVIDMIAAFYPREKITVSECGPVVGAHGGARLIAIAFARSSQPIT